ncbi:hydrogenase/urease maturation nickel metallochaperone HypA [Chloroflexota bacterium]
MEDCQALKLCFEALSVGTIAEGARLDIKRIGIYAKCTRCGLTFRSQNVRLMCPDCGERRVQLLDGEGHPTIVVSLG